MKTMTGNSEVLQIKNLLLCGISLKDSPPSQYLVLLSGSGGGEGKPQAPGNVLITVVL